MNIVNKLSKNTWAAVIIFGMIGQMAWMVENVYFNTFLFNEIGGNTIDISRIVAISAIVSTITTIFMGALSDRFQKRKYLLSIGYILWGIVTCAFALLTRNNISSAFGLTEAAVITSLSVMLVIVMDCVMSFFGATSNDATFNAWITDVTDDTNRASVDGVLATFPFFAMLLVTGLSGVLINSFGYPIFFIYLGAPVTVCGILGLILIKEKARTIPKNTHYMKDVIYGFLPSTVRQNRMLYLTFIAYMVFMLSFDTFMPYLLIYLEHGLGFTTMQYTIVMVIAITVAGVIGIILGKVMDRKGRDSFYYISWAIYTAALFALIFIKSLSLWVVGGILLLTGDILLMTVISATIRDHTPKDKVGLFQGVRLFFSVLIPMIIGPYLGEWSIRNATDTMVNEYGESVSVPTATIFLTSGIIALFIIIPFGILRKRMAKENGLKKTV
jgi:MFS family permease